MKKIIARERKGGMKYKLLKDLPFMRKDTNFEKGCWVGGGFGIDLGNDSHGVHNGIMIFEQYENDTLESILDNKEWIEKIPEERIIMSFFRVILSRLESNLDWQIVSNPRWDYFTKAQSAILDNGVNDYAEYKNGGRISRMVRFSDLESYGLKINDESWVLDPRHNAKGQWHASYLLESNVNPSLKLY